ncbi:MAG: hypothetical protein ABFS34_02740 [Gemmatimonadota bacterium]
MASAFVLLSVVDHHFFQREHVFLALTLPYLCLASARLARVDVPLPLVVLVGAVGGVGFWLKPFYLPIWLLVEGVVAVRLGVRRLARPESIAVVAAGILYGAAVALWAPAYLRVAGWGATLYRSYGARISLAEILFDPRALAAYIVVLFAILLRKRYPVGPLRTVLLVALVGYIGAVAAQGKSFTNHWYPAEGLLLLAGYQTLAEVSDVRWAHRLRTLRVWLLWPAAFALILLAAANAANTTSRWRAAYQADPFYLTPMTDFLKADGGARSFFTIGATMRSSFPLALAADVEYVSRFHSLWLLAGLYDGACPEPCRPFAYNEPERMGPAERYQFDALVTDLISSQPDVLFVDLVPPNGLAGFDYVEYFSQSARFEHELASYLFIATIGGRYRAYRRAGRTTPSGREKVAK